MESASAVSSDDLHISRLNNFFACNNFVHRVSKFIARGLPLSVKTINLKQSSRRHNESIHNLLCLLYYISSQQKKNLMIFFLNF